MAINMVKNSQVGDVQRNLAMVENLKNKKGNSEQKIYKAAVDAAAKKKEGN